MLPLEQTTQMDIEEYIQALEIIKTKLLSMPEEDVLGDTFVSEQQELTQLIEKLPNYSSEEQERARLIMSDFATQLNEKLERLKANMEKLSMNMGEQQARVRGMKAYTISGKLF